MIYWGIFCLFVMFSVWDKIPGSSDFYYSLFCIITAITCFLTSKTEFVENKGERNKKLFINNSLFFIPKILVFVVVLGVVFGLNNLLDSKYKITSHIIDYKLPNSGQLDVSEWRNIVAIDAGNYHSVGLREDGTVIATGLNNENQCNVSGWTNIVEIVADKNYTVGLTSSGHVVVAGDSLTSPVPWEEPTDLDSIDNIQHIYSDNGHLFLLSWSGKVFEHSTFGNISSIEYELPQANYIDIKAMSSLSILALDDNGTIVVRVPTLMSEIGEILSEIDENMNIFYDFIDMETSYNLNTTYAVNSYGKIIVIRGSDYITESTSRSLKNNKLLCNIENIVDIELSDYYMLTLDSKGDVDLFAPLLDDEYGFTDFNDIVDIAVGNNFFLTLDDNGNVYATGSNEALITGEIKIGDNRVLGADWNPNPYNLFDYLDIETD